jgi:hypothetical protein
MNIVTIEVEGLVGIGRDERTRSFLLELVELVDFE